MTKEESVYKVSKYISNVLSCEWVKSSSLTLPQNHTNIINESGEMDRSMRLNVPSSDGS